ncbi:Uma2 family endonuclease [Planctomicrobium sp. SH661]|uniref:Uma2 family endonuclease n=1 Tax=Planctomicrobium sp. SH661 TaxID=3448124 RepID=UPI003F5C5349
MSTITLLTADEFDSMSFDMPVELIRGEVVEMTNPGGRHGAICFRLAGILHDWLKTAVDYVALTNDTGVLLERNPDTVRGPDLMVFHQSRLPQGRIPTGHFRVAPDVAIEVVSPSDRIPDILQKVSLFLRAGVGEVWVIYPDRQHVHIYKSDDEPTILDVDHQLTSPLLPGFTCTVHDLFRGIAT